MRIYLDNPADTARWLLAPRAPALPRVLAAVRPLVLPKLREETERARGKAKGKRRGVKDVVGRGEWRVSSVLVLGGRGVREEGRELKGALGH